MQFPSISSTKKIFYDTDLSVPTSKFIAGTQVLAIPAIGKEIKAKERREKVKSVIESLQEEDLNNLQERIKELGLKENPLLLAAEYGSYKILKSITELGDKIRTREDFTFDDCNEYGENVLHLRKSFNSEYHHKNYDCLFHFDLLIQNCKRISYILFQC